MATAAITLLALGLLLSLVGLATYLQIACTEVGHRPDHESLAIARGFATIGRNAVAFAIPAWFTTGTTASPGVALLLVLGTAAALATYSTKPGRLTSRGRPIA
jgi:hypothetical protein